MSIRILIADDQALVRAGFRKILEAEPGLEVVAEAGDGVEACAAARRTGPDVILMDIRMPRMDGLEATRRLARGSATPARILILTTFGRNEYVYEALRAGASGFLLKDAPPEELIAAVGIVASGEALLAPSITRAVIDEFARRTPLHRDPPPELGELTPREREVLHLLARGLSNAEIARALVVSGATVRTHVAHVLMKLGLRDRIQAVIYAYESGLIAAGATYCNGPSRSSFMPRPAEVPLGRSRCIRCIGTTCARDRRKLARRRCRDEAHAIAGAIRRQLAQSQVAIAPAAPG
jgi:DNA-binding NarL/FixJ family response regulator